MNIQTRNKSSYYSKLPVNLNNRGFTLVEIVLVVGIIGILSAIGFPTLSRWIPNYQLKAATRELYADFQKAKLHAVKTNKDVKFNFTAVGDCSSPTGYTFTDDASSIAASRTLDHGVCIYASTFLATSGFDPRGLPAGTLGTVKLKHTKISREYAISQSLSGNIRIK